MNVHVSYKTGKTPDVEREFQYQIKKLEPRLQVFKPDLVSLHAVVEQAEDRGISASLNLRLPSGQMAVQRSEKNALAAAKSAFADLISQVTKHKELLRGQWTRKALRRAGRERLTQMPIPAEAAAPRGNGKAHAQAPHMVLGRRGLRRRRPMARLWRTWSYGLAPTCASWKSLLIRN